MKFGDTDFLFADGGKEGQFLNHIIRVAFEAGVDAEFDYLVADKFWPLAVGQRVEAPFGKGNKIQKGFCVEIVSDLSDKQTSNRKLKAISTVLDKEPLLDSSQMELARWISS